MFTLYVLEIFEAFDKFIDQKVFVTQRDVALSGPQTAVKIRAEVKINFPISLRHQMLCKTGDYIISAEKLTDVDMQNDF